jgi:hypothetical protein
MPQFILDKLNSFGQVNLSGAGTAFPDTLNLDGAEIGRMTVDIKVAGATPAGGTGITATVQGSNDEAFGTSTVLGQRVITLADLTTGKGKIAISPSRFQYVRVTLTKSGTFTAGLVEAYVNSYEGK